MKKLYSLLLVLVPFYGLLAQDSVVVNKDPRLDILNTKQAAINRLTSHMTSSGMYKGYRLQVISTRSRDQAFHVKGELLQKFPEQKVYALYQSPYFKIRMGNFFERSEAEKWKRTVTRYYPQGVFVVEDVIEYKPTDLDTGNDTTE